MRWKARGAGLLVGVAGTVGALATADNAEQHATVGWVVIGAVVAGFVGIGVTFAVLRRKVAGGWRPGRGVLTLSAAGSLGYGLGMLMAWFGPPELTAPLLGLGGGIGLGAAFLPGVPDVPGERTGEQLVEDMKAEERRRREQIPWTPNPFGDGVRRLSLRSFAGLAYGFALVCLYFVVRGPVRPQDTRLDFALYALALVAIGVALTGLSWLWHRHRPRDPGGSVSPAGRPRAGRAPRPG
jgi:hypothetical protein